MSLIDVQFIFNAGNLNLLLYIHAEIDHMYYMELNTYIEDSLQNLINELEQIGYLLTFPIWNFNWC